MKNKRNIMYGVIGVATLMLSIIGATFAYFTATADNTATIKGNMATIDFDVSVVKMTNVDVTKKGLIPMSNNMMEQALTKNAAAADKGICVDDNGNAVCQVYKIIVNNNSTSSMFVDGYVTLFNGSGIPTDYPESYYQTGQGGAKTVNTSVVKNTTTMRWAQAFCTGDDNSSVSSCTTGGNSTVRSTNTITLKSVAGNYTTLGGSTTMNKGANLEEMAIERNSIITPASDSTNAATIQGNKYEVISKNFIRLSNHASDDTTFTRTDDTTSALVYNQYLGAKDTNNSNDDGNSSTTFNDSQVYYIVVWLSETGENQTVGADNAATSADGFFSGKATFISGEGSEVSATFSGLTKVDPTDTPANQS